MSDIGEKDFPCIKGWCVMCRRLKVRFPDNNDPYYWCPKRGHDACPADVIEDCDGFVYMMDDERECQNCVNFKRYDRQLGSCMKTNRTVYSYDYVCDDYEEIVEHFEKESI